MFKYKFLQHIGLSNYTKIDFIFSSGGSFSGQVTKQKTLQLPKTNKDSKNFDDNKYILMFYLISIST